MAKRPCYRPLENYVGYRTVDSAEFKWNPGFAFSQKQKNVVALHDAIHRIDPAAKVLEISSKSLQPLGVSLSAFNLKFTLGLGRSQSFIRRILAPFVTTCRKRLPDIDSSRSISQATAGHLSRRRRSSTSSTSRRSSQTPSWPRRCRNSTPSPTSSSIRTARSTVRPPPPRSTSRCAGAGNWTRRCRAASPSCGIMAGKRWRRDRLRLLQQFHRRHSDEHRHPVVLLLPWLEAGGDS